MKIGYIDHSFHQKTQSSKFFVDLLRRNGLEVEYIWDDSWRGGKAVNLDELIGSYDSFIFHQLSAFASKPYYKLPVNITYLPMLDNFGNDQLFHFNRDFWKHYAGVKVLSFSKALNSAILSHGLASKYVQYFPDPSNFTYKENEIERLKGFFWQRVPEQINWEIIKKLVKDANFSSIHIHNAVDPGLQPYYPSNKDIKDFNISISDWFPERQDLYKVIAENEVYFTPRSSEGIGMSFLEAMAMGKCVVSPNYGTMNEYILNGINGLLYDLKNPHQLNFANIKEICKLARHSVEIGYEQWLSKEEEIVDFIVKPSNDIYSVYYPNGYNLDDIARVSSNQEASQLYTNNNKDSSLQRLKKKVASSKAAPYIRPIWRLMKRNLSTHNKPVKLNNSVELTKTNYSTQCNISKTSVNFPFGEICGKYFSSETSKDNIICEGGLRLKGDYKKSFPNKPLVSIVTVVWNRAQKLERSMKSVFNQTYDNIEYIIVDGGSTDGTVDIIKKYEDAIDYYVSESDKGIYNAINKGLTFASGDFIGILNSDDWFTPDAIELSVKELLKQEADYSGAEEYVINEDGSLVGIYELKPFNNIALLAQNPCNHGTMFISRKAYEVIGFYDETFRIAADYKMQLLLVTNPELKPCTVQKPIHYYEVAGISSIERSKTLAEVKQILKYYHKNLLDSQIDSLIDFMHDFKMDENIVKDLESILSKNDYTLEQKEYLLNRMVTYGYKQKSELYGAN
ncbi:glycosyltransferase [Paenibacillus chondroitinus]|uniref:Glycosyltransferase n=1 Tax=Paenibacillus chondroitinus TaxID=59842 RepID=A0ABU6DD97_9BACL|nr:MULTISPECIES: glycosyltransferase [Paenibacillus]MCY9657467.1 glycosyltransferase [Paenibacillus anseongense]MEB4794913.1 glycosyltransferase [Paenibacillus chondroitinus]